MEEKYEEQENTERQKKKLLISFLIVLVGSLLLIATLFAPFASATKDYKAQLQKNPDEMYAEETNMTNGEAINLSLFEYGKMYAKTAELGISRDISITCLVIISAFAVFAILTTLFSVLKKPIATIVFSLLSFGIFRVIIWDFDDRGVIQNSHYVLGFAQFFCYIGAAIIIAGSIVLLLLKNKSKKENKATALNEGENT